MDFISEKTGLLSTSAPLRAKVGTVVDMLSGPSARGRVALLMAMSGHSGHEGERCANEDCMFLRVSPLVKGGQEP